MIGQSLSLAGLQKRYGEALAVRELSLEIAAGEFVSLLGPSGSGKTTALTMIAGFESPSAGKIAIGGRDVTFLAPNHRNIGMVFQKYALFPHLTIRQNVAFPLRMRGRMQKTAIAQRVEEMLDLVQLSSYAERYPNQLSGGQQQRVALARALAFEPPVLLMDEPLGALDNKLREAMQFEIKRLQERLGATVVYVTHDQDEAMTMSDRVAIMSNGGLIQVGTPTQLYRQPNTEFVADFIGRMNFLDGDCLDCTAEQTVVRFSERTVLKLRAAAKERTRKYDAGTALRVAIRPERMRLAKRGDGGADALPGVVDAAVFIGSTYIFLVRLADRPEVSLQVQVPADGLLPFQRDDEVDIVLDGAAMHVFPVAERCAA
ncbi:mannopine transport system ATP-binding protein [Sinorhizobium meliloti]|uniref:ABC transporter ATP-binding protein n=1 Tax=Rhizobium meliloti TaxID=382 RepID=UPI000B49A45C|nr:ABC transporter ATP-binding protein [Sinorhizobium meliloti]ASJ61654.1 polyamine ABC transporter ATP-binding protein [Sinorhizobium meliloti]ASQ06650.1 ABC transporter ATP-binding protein [Sinorhizobium meliloti]MCK3785293.1 ABC transporter ATP-binding protein [Sinorhizobium meliloti]MCK3791418.1 ABC transporter ATP-binding protein [Sinorhizobium meliloti]MCK3797452.1 ABC transporter ATP-binding protein [Sinorhizobium meliloti]